ncbi:glycoside hydrolase family 6 protein [Frankia sp. Cas4]|uniref:glycoside hydrolase family 6 protein n=1 Tax=Frankia sp. Cas4 TaxID=3073927 RepID=UPI002AD3D185|nr:glycoside hydrolase family 6 protein [Frankia sp. Cas4]
MSTGPRRRAARGSVRHHSRHRQLVRLRRLLALSAVVISVLAGFAFEGTIVPSSRPAAADLVLSGPGGTVASTRPVTVAQAMGALGDRPDPARSTARPLPGSSVARAGSVSQPGSAPTSTPIPEPTSAPLVLSRTQTGNPFAGARFYVDPGSAAAAAVGRLRGSLPASADALSRIANTSHADWFVGPVTAGGVQSAVAGRVARIRAAGALPVLVAYAIPNRDCGGYSGGGASSPAAYRSWISGFAAGIGRGPATVILEPDALSQLDCLPAADRQTRYGLLSDAVDALGGIGVSVYLDAGNAGWHDAAEMATRLRAAGVDRARGFALNVSNFDETADERAYGDAVSAAAGGMPHFVIDTSRNGLGPAPGSVWCNPPGRALGVGPTADTGDPRADALLWIKVPGESDGTCNGGPPAGQWWLDYAIGLAVRAAA